ncbi:hypothetical protein [Paracoccus alkenifer]|uniref:Uncharacterized protein n=1 Tax=Paracoccus alkenifer TaxID=65735 RepID=A0A1H6JJI9_9RHOB|nr:hypothetical protein [Paracoccus alkenifer]SEH60666.1 hypothetical protein SAMN04488075_0325 [Paracoccus alkenifer]
MTGRQASYTDDERERLRKALADHAGHYSLSAQQLADRIAEGTNYAISLDAGRKRVERFLKSSHRQTDDFIGAVAAYLGSVPPPDIEQSAAMLVHFFTRRVRQDDGIENLIGRYRVYASTDRRAHGHVGFREIMVMNQWADFTAAPIKPMISRVPYAVIDMKPMPKEKALLVSEAIINFHVDPEIEDFPDVQPRDQDAGVIVAFGYSDRNVPRYLMATRTILETRLYRLYKVSDDPLTLRGELNFNGATGRPHNATHSNPLHPDYEVELVRIEDEQDGAAHRGFPAAEG